jgi:hypothetical protein
MEPLTVGAIALVVAGAALAYLGTTEASRGIMVLSSTLLRTGMAWLHIVVGVSLTGLGARQLGICVVLGILFSYLLQYLFFLLPSVAGVAAFVAIPFACYLLAAPYARLAFESLASAKPPFVSSITQPTSFLPFFHQMFLSILVFRIVCGFELSFGEVAGIPLKTFLFPVATLVLALIIIIFKWQIRTDPLFEASALLIVAGLLLVPLSTAVGAQPVVSIILSSGRTFFDFLFWFLLVTIASRNPHGAVTVFAWGNALSCFGLVLGAFLGRLTNEYAAQEPVMTLIVTGAILWFFVAYILILLRRFSFDAAILAIVPETEPVFPATAVDFRALDSMSERLAAKFGLTTREARCSPCWCAAAAVALSPKPWAFLTIPSKRTSSTSIASSTSTRIRSCSIC